MSYKLVQCWVQYKEVQCRVVQYKVMQCRMVQFNKVMQCRMVHMDFD